VQYICKRVSEMLQLDDLYKTRLTDFCAMS